MLGAQPGRAQPQPSGRIGPAARQTPESMTWVRAGGARPEARLGTGSSRGRCKRPKRADRFQLRSAGRSCRRGCAWRISELVNGGGGGFPPAGSDHFPGKDFHLRPMLPRTSGSLPTSGLIASLPVAICASATSLRYTRWLRATRQWPSNIIDDRGLSKAAPASPSDLPLAHRVTPWGGTTHKIGRAP